MSQKGWFVLLFIIVVIASIISGIENISRISHGCTDEVLSDFKKLKLAQDYQEAYILTIQFEAVLKGYSIGTIEPNWVIENYEDGCKIYFEASYYIGKTFRYHGDNFFINLEERQVYPLDDSVREFLETSDYNTRLP